MSTGRPSRKATSLPELAGDAFAGNDDADEIQGIGGGDGDESAGGLLMAGGPQGFNYNRREGCHCGSSLIGDSQEAFSCKKMHVPDAETAPTESEPPQGVHQPG